MYVSIRSIKIFGIWPHVRTYADRQTYTRVLQCSHASVGLAQARPNNMESDYRGGAQPPPLLDHCVCVGGGGGGGGGQWPPWPPISYSTGNDDDTSRAA